MSTKKEIPLWKKTLARIPKMWSEKLDPTPVAVPAGFGRPPTLQEQMIALIRSEDFKRSMASQGFETIDEAEDFETEDYDPTSPYELEFEPDLGREVTKQERHQLREDKKIFDKYAKDMALKAKKQKAEKVKEKPDPSEKKEPKE